MSPAKRRSGNKSTGFIGRRVTGFGTDDIVMWDTWELWANVMNLDSGHAEKLKDLMLIMLETNQFDKSVLLSGPVIPEPNTSTF